MKVLIVNRSSVSLGAWADFLGEDERISGVDTALDEVEALRRAHECRYDLVLTGRDCVARLSQWRRKHGAGIGEPLFVLLSHDVSGPIRRYAFASGFDAVVDSNLSLEELVSELVEIRSGCNRLRVTVSASPEFADLLVSRESPEIVERDEIDGAILGLLAEGLSDKQISAVVYLSCQTVRNRISRILHRSGIANRTQLAVVYLRREQQRCQSCVSGGAPEIPVQQEVVGQVSVSL